MIRMVDTTLGGAKDHLWVGIPSEMTVEIATVDEVPHVVFLNLGSDVYAALMPHNATNLTRADNQDGWKDRSQKHTKLTWTFDGVGALVMEVGTKKEHGGYDAFKTAIREGLSTGRLAPGPENGRVLSYTSTLGHRTRMQYVPPTEAFTFHDGTTWEPAGTLPRLWRDGLEVDFEAFDAYRVVSGKPLVHQGWGSGQLTAVAGKSGQTKGLSITVSPETAQATYCRIDENHTTN